MAIVPSCLHYHVLALIVLCCVPSQTDAQSFSECFNSATETVAASSCPLEDATERRDCIANVLTTSVLPCFKEASQLDLVHLLVPEIEESIVTELRNAAKNYLDFSGNEIIIHSIPTQEILAAITSYFENNDVFYSGWIIPSPTLPFLNELDVMVDLAANLTQDLAFDWTDVASSYRTGMITIGDSVVGIPVSGDLVFLYYRKDIFEAQNISQPFTWEQVLVLAEQFNGTDLNDDGIPDFGTCLVNSTSVGRRSLWIKAIMAPYFQHMGQNQGILFDSENLEPLLDNDAMAWILDLYSELAKFGPYNQPEIRQITEEELFKSGRCLLTVGSAYIFHQYGKGTEDNIVGVAELPGSWYIYDRPSSSLTRCTTALCPHGRADTQGSIVNFTPYNGPMSMVAAVSRKAPKANRDRLSQFLTYLGGKSLSFELIVSVSHLAPFRWSHLQVDRWLERGWNYYAALDFINAMSRSFVSGNILWDPQLPDSLKVDEALEKAGDDLIRSDGEAAQVLKALKATLNSRIDAYGREQLLRIYRSSLHLDPLQNVSAVKAGSSGGTNTWVLVLGLCLPLSVLSICSMWCCQCSSGRAGSRRRRSAKPPNAGPQTSLVITDIQDSTTLWETLDADVMDEALQLHNACLREVLRRNHGYESATEGDAFIIAFHTAYDAVMFCREAQLALMEIDWPEDVLQASTYSSVIVKESENTLKYVVDALLARKQSNALGQSVPPTSFFETEDADAALEGAAGGDSDEDPLLAKPLEDGEANPAAVESNEEEHLFRGLRVRMGVFTGIQSPSDVMMNDASGRMMYSGVSMAMTKAVSDVGSGGQIVMTESTYKAMGLEKFLDNVHVFHLGEYRVSDALPTTQFYEIVEKALVSRLLHFPTLKAQALSPAWYDAPSGVVCISFNFVVGAETLSQWNGRVFREALYTYESLAKKLLQYYRGYQVEAADGLFLGAFSDSADAILWGLTLQDELSKAEWPKELLTHPLCEKMSVHSVDRFGHVHLKDVIGLRLKTGIERGPAKCNPHQTTGFMAYRGKVINRAARITKLASGAQVYTSRGVWEAAQSNEHFKEKNVRWRSMGTQKLKGVVETVDVYHVFFESKDALQQVSLDISSRGSSNYSDESEF